MATRLLIIIYIAFISLGLPDAILGSAWPLMHQDLQVATSAAGILTMIVAGSTIISSLFSVRLIYRFGTGRVTAASVALTAFALVGISLTPGVLWMALLGIPLGLGAGAVDSGLNNFVALNYQSRHMNWLHCFWGVGATAGPLVMSLFMLRDHGWRLGYATIGTLQVLLVIGLALTLPIWRSFERPVYRDAQPHAHPRLATLVRLPGAKAALLAFFAYCAVELTTGLWGSTYLVTSRGMAADQAARWISLYYLGITAGRFLSGFLTIRLNNRQMIRLGMGTCLLGVILLILPLAGWLPMISLILIGLGCAPIFPAMLHETPNRFGAELSQGLMGLQMATAYIGSTLAPPLFGLIASLTGFAILPVFLLVLAVIMALSSEMVNRSVRHRDIGPGIITTPDGT